MIFDEDGICTGYRYTVYYKGSLFTEDSDGWNSHDTDDWNWISELLYQYGEDTEIEVKDNLYGVCFCHGEWY